MPNNPVLREYVEQSELNKLLNLFLENKNKWLILTDIRQARIVGQHRFSKWFYNQLEAVEKYCQNNELVFKFERRDRNRLYFQIADKG